MLNVLTSRRWRYNINKMLVEVAWSWWISWENIMCGFILWKKNQVFIDNGMPILKWLLCSHVAKSGSQYYVSTHSGPVPRSMNYSPPRAPQGQYLKLRWNLRGRSSGSVFSERVSSVKSRRCIWVCLKIGYIPNYSHLIWIMIINHWV